MVMENVYVVVGTQWGDEGKGRVTHYLSNDAKMVIRATGGNNAGHTVIVGSDKFAMHLLPSSIIRKDVISVIGPGVVIDPEVLVGEIQTMQKRGVQVSPDNLKISNRCHLIMPWHKDIDAILEGVKTNKIGTTGRGIGPCFSEKAQRTGIRIIDLFSEELLLSKIKESLKISQNLLSLLATDRYYDARYSWNVCQNYLEYFNILSPFVCDTNSFIPEIVDRGEKVIIEGAQAMYLDIDHGNYPYVTSSNPISSGALVGSGIGPTYVRGVIGVMKAYSSRVGEGPFPTELRDETGDRIRELGHEYGTTTGRPRRCGWLDLVLIKGAAFTNGLTGLCVNHVDTIGKFDEINVCVAYNYKNQIITYVPTDLENCKPIYKTYKGGWNTQGINQYDQLPLDTRDYLEMIEEYVDIPVVYIGVGPDEKETIIK